MNALYGCRKMSRDAKTGTATSLYDMLPLGTLSFMNVCICVYNVSLRFRSCDGSTKNPQEKAALLMRIAKERF